VLFRVHGAALRLSRLMLSTVMRCNSSAPFYQQVSGGQDPANVSLLAAVAFHCRSPSGVVLCDSLHIRSIICYVFCNPWIACMECTDAVVVKTWFISAESVPMSRFAKAAPSTYVYDSSIGMSAQYRAVRAQLQSAPSYTRVRDAVATKEPSNPVPRQVRSGITRTEVKPHAPPTVRTTNTTGNRRHEGKPDTVYVNQRATQERRNQTSKT
jgi:hypothetical protein